MTVNQRAKIDRFAIEMSYAELFFNLLTLGRDIHETRNFFPIFCLSWGGRGVHEVAIYTSKYGIYIYISVRGFMDFNNIMIFHNVLYYDTV